jgi:glucose-6-phosphate 1-dehydrogenase
MPRSGGTWPRPLDELCLGRFLDRLRYVAVDAQAASGFDALAAELDDPERVRVFYLATSPDLFGPICGHLAAAGLMTAHDRVVLEKPISHDLASARVIGAVLAENQIFRNRPLSGQGDGPEPDGAALCQLAVRAARERRPRRPRPDHGRREPGRRGPGCLLRHRGRAPRHMVQNHIVQLLCLVAMEPPTRLGPDAVRDEKLKVLRFPALSPARWLRCACRPRASPSRGSSTTAGSISSRLGCTTPTG